jgi:ATP-dependent RNA helicase RhlE
MTDFNSLKLAAPLMKALGHEGYTIPTPIQAQAIPIIMGGTDLMGIAQTGTGKTAAFALPILNRLNQTPGSMAPRKGARVLVLAPTRELASQIADAFRALGRFMELNVITVFGGVPVNRQIRQLHNGVDVMVATPGRLLDLIDQKACTLSGVEILVLDEADQMLDLGFIHDLKRINALVPRRRQTLFFSATMPAPIIELSRAFLNAPETVSVAPAASVADRVEQTVTHVKIVDKQALLSHILKDKKPGRTIVFTRTKHGADRVVRKLLGDGLRAEAIHGNKSQAQRERALDAFRSGRCAVLVATDIAARGIDVSGVDLVVNFELPNVAEQYVHRIGRTARAGAAGQAIAFVGEDEGGLLRGIEKLTRQPIEVTALPEGYDAPKVTDPKARPPRQKPTGKRPSGPRGGYKRASKKAA